MEQNLTPDLADSPGRIVLADELLEIATRSLGEFFEPICGIDRHVIARNFLDYARSFKRAEILKRYAPMQSRKLLEIGSRFGTNLRVWMKHSGVDGWGVEPGAEGFNQGYLASRKLFAANGLDPEQVINTEAEPPLSG